MNYGEFEKKVSRNDVAKDTSGSVDLRTLSRGESNILSTSLDLHTAFGRTPVNRNTGQIRA